MAYIKVITENGYILGLGINKAVSGGISEKEYNELTEIFKKKPEDTDKYRYMLNAKTLEFDMIEKSDDPEKGNIDPAEAWKIISSSNISKEDKEKLYKYIYAKEELK